LGKLSFKKTAIPGVWLIEPAMHLDNRGRFFRSWCSLEFAEHGINFVPQQANMGLSLKKGTVRGMHYQVAPALEAKLVRCTAGRMFDVALDMREGSPTFGRWFGAELSAENGSMLYLPELCAHGYQTLVDGTEMHYMASQVFSPEAARGIRFDDPAFKVSWPLDVTEMSDQDRNWPLYKA
jgi:dTDP-4-dehydrorhamnose 3,5-epimerase